MEPVYQFQHTHLKLPKIRFELTNPLGYPNKNIFLYVLYANLCARFAHKTQPKAAEVCKIITANYLSHLVHKI